MSDEQAQQLLHDAGDQVAVGAPPTTALIRAGRRAKTRRRLVGVAGTAAVTALVIGVAVALVDQGDVRSPVAEPPASQSTPDGLKIPPGTRLVGAKGFAVAVPEEWTTHQRCGDWPFVATVVLAPGDGHYCEPDTAELSALHVDSFSAHANWMASRTRAWKTIGSAVVERSTIKDACAAIDSCVPSSRWLGAIAVPSADLLVYVSSPEKSTIRSILDSVRPIPDGYTAVPDVWNANEATAKRKLDGAGLVTDEVDRDACRSVNRCALSVVDSSTPPAGAVVPVGAEVSLVMTSGIDGWPPEPTVKLLSGGRLAVTTRGSSSCPETVASTRSAEGNRVVVALKAPGQGDCTSDLAAATSTTLLPGGIDEEQPLVVTITRGGESIVTTVLQPR